MMQANGRQHKRKRTFLSVLALGALAIQAYAGTEPTLRGTISAVRGEQLEPEALLERLDGVFKDAEDEGAMAGDALARAYLDAAALAHERAMPDVAAAFFRDADLCATDPDLRARARFNFAQIRYVQAVGAMTPTEERPAPDVEAAKARLLESARAFRAVLDADPTDAVAARHTERVRRMIQKLDEIQQQARDEAQQRADEMREQADRLDELADRQEQESEQNDRGEQGQETASADQSGLNEETQQQSDEMRETNPGSDAQQRLNEAMERQAQAQQELQDGDPSGAAESQAAAAERLREAATALREQADKQEGEQQGEGDAGEPEDGEQEGEPGEEEGESQSDRFSEWLLDREQRQREQQDRQLRSMRGRPMPVERDW